MEKEISFVAKKYLKKVCGDMVEPNAKDIIKHCAPIIEGNMKVSASFGDDSSADYDNREIAKIARNAFLMGYLFGQNDIY